MTIVFISVIIGVFLLVIIIMGIKALNKPYTAGREGLIGEVGITKTDLDPRGSVFVHGTLWNAVSLEGDIPKGNEIVVVFIEGLKLSVKKVT